MTLEDQIRVAPHSPGVYRYYNAEGEVIYVGKAKDLKKRISQYFVSQERLNRKTQLLVSKIASLQYSVVDSEADAFLLENNLIKQYKPKYNILLKDSKSYPRICVTGETFPRIYLCRKNITSASNRYFGPYSDVRHARRMLELLEELYPFRHCKKSITATSILRKKERPCLDFHIGKCKGCCVGGVSADEYGRWVADAVSLLKGGSAPLLRQYKAAMEEASEALEFEKAEAYLQKIKVLQEHYAKSIVALSTISEADVFYLVSEGDDVYGNFLRVREGSVVQSYNMSFKLRLDEGLDEVLSLFIYNIKEMFGELSGEIIVPFEPDFVLDGIKITVPQKGDKMALLNLSRKNATQMRIDSLNGVQHTDPDAFHTKILESLKAELSLDFLPHHIECFDNSNLQGTNPVASCVVFRDGVPSKKDYRHFNIKTVVGANDYASMKEVVNRRYSRLYAEAPDDLPELVVIDGGKGQLAFAYEALCELGLQGKIKLISLAKRLEEVYRIGDPYPLYIDKNSLALKTLQQLRDEAHRFGITHHRKRRSKSMFK